MNPFTSNFYTVCVIGMLSVEMFEFKVGILIGVHHNLTDCQILKLQVQMSVQFNHRNLCGDK